MREQRPDVSMKAVGHCDLTTFGMHNILFFGTRSARRSVAFRIAVERPSNRNAIVIRGAEILTAARSTKRGGSAFGDALAVLIGGVFVT